MVKIFINLSAAASSGTGGGYSVIDAYHPIPRGYKAYFLVLAEESQRILGKSNVALIPDLLKSSIQIVISIVTTATRKLHGYPDDWKGKRRFTGLTPEDNLARAATRMNDSSSKITEADTWIIDAGASQHMFVDEPTCLPPIGTGDIITPATADSLECPSVDTQSSSIVSLVGEKVLVEPPDSSDAVSAIAPTKLVIVLVYVDNLLVTGSCTTLIDKTRNDLKLNFKVKDLGELKFFLGIEFTRSKEEYVMNQLKYALELISEMGLSGAKPVYTPPDANVRLTTIEYCTHTQGSEAVITDKPFDNIERYQRLVGRLLYLTMTRVDISFTVQVLSQFMHAPKESHMEATLRVVKYIKESPGLGLFMPGKISELLTTYCDSDWGTFLQIRRSVTGYLLKFGDAIISWISKKQDTMA
uniref:Reverse transcriptase Ty1/copia-type domain-containing protein n=1 Tax=Solanum lycopersicum TaxID=4081 RepID=A0A3Q7IVH7_SOLLC